MFTTIWYPRMGYWDQYGFQDENIKEKKSHHWNSICNPTLRVSWTIGRVTALFHVLAFRMSENPHEIPLETQ